MRVPLDDFRHNLGQIADTAKQHDCRVVFITAPTSLAEGRLPDWAFSAFRQYYEMTQAEIHNIPATHRQYTDAVREVAAQEGQFVLDLASIWPEQSTELFRSDCVHLTEQGHQRAAEGLIELWQVAIARGDAEGCPSVITEGPAARRHPWPRPGDPTPFHASQLVRPGFGKVVLFARVCREIEQSAPAG